MNVGVTYTTEAYFGPSRGWLTICEVLSEQYARDVAKRQAESWGRKARVYRSQVELITETEPREK